MQVLVTVPATTANLGPGFDCLGIALSLYNRVSIMRSDSSSRDEMIHSAASLFFQRSQISPFPFQWKIEGEVPRSRGLGSSVTVRLGVLCGLNALSGSPLNQEALYRLCMELEGHPDNAAPAVFGGFTVARANGDYVHARIDSQLKFILWIPEYQIETTSARGVLPEKIDRLVAVRNIADASFITAAFLTQNYALLKGVFHDGIHQPYRKQLIPKMNEILGAAESAGALGAWLSGSGSALAAVTMDHADAIATAMLEAGSVKASTLVLSPDNQGVRVEYVK